MVNCIEKLTDQKCPTCNAKIERSNPNWELLDFIEDPNHNKLKTDSNKVINEIERLKDELQINQDKKLKENSDKMKQLRNEIISKTEEKVKLINENQRLLCNETKTIETNLKKILNVLVSKDSIEKYIIEKRNSLNKNLEEAQLNSLLEELITKKRELNNKIVQIKKSEIEYTFHPNNENLKSEMNLIGEINEAKQVKHEHITSNSSTQSNFIYRDLRVIPKSISSSVAVKNTSIEKQIENYDAIHQYMFQGVDFISKQNYIKAIDCFDSVIKLEPNYYQSYVLKANVQCQLDKYQDGIKNYNKSLELNPEQLDTLLKKADALNELEQYDEAISSIDKALQLNPNRYETHNKKGFTLYKMEKYQQAIDSFNEVSRLNPMDNFFAHVKGSCLAKIGKHDEGIKCIDKALSMNPDQLRELYVAKSEILKSQNKKREAIGCLNKVLALNPNDHYVLRMKKSFRK